MRYKILGERPGTTIQVGGRFVNTHRVDGGAHLTDEQRDELIKRGYQCEELGVDEPADEAPVADRQIVHADAQAKARMEEQASAARQRLEAADRPPTRESVATDEQKAAESRRQGDGADRSAAAQAAQSSATDASKPR